MAKRAKISDFHLEELFELFVLHIKISKKVMEDLLMKMMTKILYLKLLKSLDLTLA